MFRKAEMVYFLYRNKKKYIGLESGHLRKEQPRKSDVAVIAWIFQKTVTVSLISVDSLSFTGAVKPPTQSYVAYTRSPGETTLFFDVSPVSLFITALVYPPLPIVICLDSIGYCLIRLRIRPRPASDLSPEPLSFFIVGFHSNRSFIMWFSGW